jgi:hypothetical protein
MSGFVDFVIADRRESKKLLKHDTPTKQWPGFEWKWVDEFQLAYLYGVLRESKDRYKLADKLKTDRLRTGQSVTELPAKMTELLAGLDKKARALVAREWRKCEEFFDSGDQKAALELVNELCDLAQRAKADGKPILVRQSGAV